MDCDIFQELSHVTVFFLISLAFHSSIFYINHVTRKDKAALEFITLSLTVIRLFHFGIKSRIVDILQMNCVSP